MTGIYLSGTGNTKHCITKLLSLIDRNSQCIPIESTEAKRAIIADDTIFLAYPTQFSNAPYMVRDIIHKDPTIWKGKRVFCMTTMGAFSGDGTGCTARILKKYGADIIGGIQIRMPDSVCDNKMLKKSLDDNKHIVSEADRKIEEAANSINNGVYPQEGLSPAAHAAGLMGQRLWFYGKTAGYSDKLKVSTECTGCGKCARQCPMNNIEIKNGKAVPLGRCTMCYRCISSCPKQALTLLGNTVIEQCRYEKYAV